MPWLRRIWERLKTFLYFVHLLVVVAYNWFFAPHEYKPRAGDPCGPNHRWTYIWPPWDPELSCEKITD